MSRLALRTSAAVTAPSVAEDPARVWSQEECAALYKRIVALAPSEGDTIVIIRVSWRSSLPWARNRPMTASVSLNPRVVIRRVINGKVVQRETTEFDDTTLDGIFAQLAHRLSYGGEGDSLTELPSAQQYSAAPIWSDATFQITAEGCSEAARASVLPVQAAQLFSEGILGTRVETWAIFNTKGLAAYARGTMVTFAETARTADGIASGWAGLTHPEWTKLDVKQLSARALQACVASTNPRVVEPGRYTVILAPQAVSPFFLFVVREMDRQAAEAGTSAYSGDAPGTTKIGQRILDERITISTDPRDPDCAYIPFDENGWPYRPVTWIEKGILKELPYDTAYAKETWGKEVPLPNPHAYRMSGGETSMEEMIATTERGVLISHTNLARRLHVGPNMIVSTSTRDGIWLIENGKIKFPMRNMQILESPLAIGNNVLQLGKPEPVFGGVWIDEGKENSFPPQALGSIPMVVPPMKIRDFTFTGLAERV